MTAVGSCEPGGDVSWAAVELPVGERGSATPVRRSAAESLIPSESARYELRR